MNKAVVVFSGGQDSTVCLIQAIKNYEEIHCLTFDYGQKHSAEIEIASKLAKILNILNHKIINISFFKDLSISNLIQNHKEILSIDATCNKLPNTFVPGRNIIFFTIAAIYAYKIKAKNIITGISEMDFSGYPDCRKNFLNALNTTIKLGITNNITISAPLMFLNKAEIWALSEYLNYFDLIKYHTLTCYNGIIGYGCQKCHACILRNNGLNDYLLNKNFIFNSMKNKYKNHIIHSTNLL